MPTLQSKSSLIKTEWNFGFSSLGLKYTCTLNFDCILTKSQTPVSPKMASADVLQINLIRLIHNNTASTISSKTEPFHPTKAVRS